MKVLFLDIDGVLNFSKCKSRNPHGTYGVEPDKLELIKKIIRETNCKIVISSTWRQYNDLIDFFWERMGEEWKEFFLGVTPILDTKNQNGPYVRVTRGKEIKVWLIETNFRIDNFVIIDDDHADMEIFINHVIKTNVREGLTEELTEIAIQKLKQNHLSLNTN